MQSAHPSSPLSLGPLQSPQLPLLMEWPVRYPQLSPWRYQVEHLTYHQIRVWPEAQTQTKGATHEYHVNDISSLSHSPRTLWTFSSQTTRMDQTSELYESQIAHWNDDRVPELLAASVVLIVATFVALTARFWAQRRIGKQWEADNILILFAAVRLLSRCED